MERLQQWWHNAACVTAAYTLPHAIWYLACLQEGDRAYYKLRLERTNAKLVGVRSKRAAEAAAEEAAKAK